MINVYLVSIRWRRKAAFLQRLASATLPDKLHIEYKHVNCINAVEHPCLPGRAYPSWATMDAPQALQKWWGQEVTKGERGCLLSHLSAIHEVSKSKADVNIVFEDDASVDSNLFKKLKKAIISLPDNWDCLYLGRNKVYPDAEEELINAEIIRPGFSYQGHAIAWTALAAVKVITNIEEIMQNQIPYDELLPALFGCHPREDLSPLYSVHLNAYATTEKLSIQVDDNIHDTF